MILVAPTEQAVRAALADYLRHLRDDLTLPGDCQEVLASGVADLSDAAYILLQADLAYRGDPDMGRTLRDIANVFAAAAVRVTQLYGRREAAQ